MPDKLAREISFRVPVFVFVILMATGEIVALKAALYSKTAGSVEMEISGHVYLAAWILYSLLVLVTVRIVFCKNNRVANGICKSLPLGTLYFNNTQSETLPSCKYGMREVEYWMVSGEEEIVSGFENLGIKAVLLFLDEIVSLVIVIVSCVLYFSLAWTDQFNRIVVFGWLVVLGAMYFHSSWGLSVMLRQVTAGPAGITIKPIFGRTKRYLWEDSLVLLAVKKTRVTVLVCDREGRARVVLPKESHHLLLNAWMSRGLHRSIN